VKLRLEEITTTRLTDSRDKASICSAGPAAWREGSGLRDLSVISGPKIGTARVASTGFWIQKLVGGPGFESGASRSRNL